MTLLTPTRIALALAALFATGAAAQVATTTLSVRDVSGPTAFLPLENEPPARLFVDPPIPNRLAQGAVLISYRTENFRILPIFGPSAIGVSPRAGHLHVTVDNLPWHWADASGDGTVVIVGLPPGEHSVVIELAQPDHHVITSQTVTFVVPATGSHEH